MHSVDFREHVMAPGDLLWSRPGQVQHFGDLTGAEGRLVLFEVGFLDPATAAAARIADRLGFADATNFSKFFQRQTGTTPIAFRMAVRGGAG
ncbi:AraC family transcriptional regulator [Streptomyces nigrescens]|uniref:AraC family transcriptional regulator n=1 Tax=Streptomyces nigrescens TaxID=1920 RepID=UPI003488AA4A